MSTLFNPFLEYEEALKLIENKLDINEKNGLDNNATPIFYVEDIKIVQLYINHGADLNVLDDLGHNTLYYDCLLVPDRILKIKLIIQYGAIPSDIDTYKFLRYLFSKEQQDVFDTFLLLTSDHTAFYQMCLSYQDSIKKGTTFHLQELDLI